MAAVVSPFPEDVEALKALLAAALDRADEAEARAAHAVARESAIEAVIAHLKLQIARLRREQYGARAERSRRLLEQMELQLEDLEADASEDDRTAEVAANTASVAPFERRRPVRKPFPEHLPRERVVIPAPCSCPACGGSRLSKLGEDVTETLEVIPRSWKVIQTVREKVSCRDCQTISQPPAPFHVVPRGWAGPSFLAMLLFEKYGQHQPVHRQAERFAREGVPLSVSKRLDALFDIERAINGKPAADRLAVRQELSAPLMAEFHAWLTIQRARLSRTHDLARACLYMLRRWDAFTRFLEDGRVCLSNNAAKRALRCVPLGRKAWLFCGSDRGGQRAAILYTLIQTARLNAVDPQAWLADVLARIADHPATRLDELLPWNWTPRIQVAKAA